MAMIGRAREHMPNGVPMAWMVSDNDQPVYIDHGQGAGFTDLDGFSYVDFNASDMAMFCGHASPQIVAALWGLRPDVVTIGKAVAGGLPMGAYGVTAELGGQLDAARNVATGGTLFGNPLSAAAAKAALTQVLVPGAYAHATALGGELANGIEQAIGSAGLPWTVIRFGPRSGQWYGPMPRTGAEACALADGELTRLIRIWLANRGVWEALPGAGPTVPVPATAEDVTRYLEAYNELLAQLG
jgi:glutamate-1-semialdehyde 2,1-aminomutase